MGGARIPTHQQPPTGSCWDFKVGISVSKVITRSQWEYSEWPLGGGRVKNYLSGYFGRSVPAPQDIHSVLTILMGGMWELHAEAGGIEIQAADFEKALLVPVCRFETKAIYTPTIKAVPRP